MLFRLVSPVLDVLDTNNFFVVCCRHDNEIDDLLADDADPCFPHSSG